MEIGNRYKIESDPLNVILYKKVDRKKKDTGEIYEGWQAVGYYATVENALNGLVNQKIRDTELKDLRSVLGAISELREMITIALIKSVGRKKAV